MNTERYVSTRRVRRKASEILKRPARKRRETLTKLGWTKRKLPSKPELYALIHKWIRETLA